MLETVFCAAVHFYTSLANGAVNLFLDTKLAPCRNSVNYMMQIDKPDEVSSLVVKMNVEPTGFFPCLNSSDVLYAAAGRIKIQTKVVKTLSEEEESRVEDYISTLDTCFIVRSQEEKSEKIVVVRTFTAS